MEGFALVATICTVVCIPMLIAHENRWIRICHRLGLSSRASLREVEEEIERLRQLAKEGE
jgi:hypothetical protein